MAGFLLLLHYACVQGGKLKDIVYRSPSSAGVSSVTREACTKMQTAEMQTAKMPTRTGAVEDARKERAHEGGTSIDEKIQQRLRARTGRAPAAHAKKVRHCFFDCARRLTQRARPCSA